MHRVVARMSVFLQSHAECRCFRCTIAACRKLTTKKKMARKDKEELCEELLERMSRARDVYSTFRVEMREVLKEKGKVSTCAPAPQRARRRPSAVCLLLRRRAWRICGRVLLLTLPHASAADRVHQMGKQGP